MMLLILALIFLAFADSSEFLRAHTYQETIRPILQTYCFNCHGGEKVKGDVDFVKMESEEDLTEAFETWEIAIELLKEGEMPPDAADQPSVKELLLLVNMNIR